MIKLLRCSVYVMDIVVDLVYRGLSLLSKGLVGYTTFALAAFPHSIEITTICNAIAGSLKVHELTNKVGNRLYWLHSFILVVFASFGGGVVTPLLLARPINLVSNDILLPIAFIAWYSIHHIPGVYTILSFEPVKIVWTMGVALYRTTTTVGMTRVAASILAPGPYYPIALIGPILIGTLTGSLGAFLPFDKGLTPIAKVLSSTHSYLTSLTLIHSF